MADASPTEEVSKKASSTTSSIKTTTTTHTNTNNADNNHLLNHNVSNNNHNTNNGNTKDGDSDNSGYSLGNNSFGFNFDSEEGGPSPSNSDAGAKSDEDAAGAVVSANGGAGASVSISAGRATGSGNSDSRPSHPQAGGGHPHGSAVHPSLAVAGGVDLNVNPLNNQPAATTAAVGQMQPVAQTTASVSVNQPSNRPVSGGVPTNRIVNMMNMTTVAVGGQEAVPTANATSRHPGTKQGMKRKASDTGYKSDDEASTKGTGTGRVVSASNSVSASSRSSATSVLTPAGYASSAMAAPVPVSAPVSAPVARMSAAQAQQAQGVPGVPVPNHQPSSSTPISAPVASSNTSTATTTAAKKKKVTDEKREERNLREKERSYRITSQINELRNLLSSGGVIVPKGTKNAVLTEAANYIRLLQQHQYKSEIHRQQLIQQMQLIGSGQLGPQAANAIRHVAAKNGVWSLGNFGGMPPRSAMVPAGGAPQQQGLLDVNGGFAAAPQAQPQASKDGLLKDIEDTDYRFVFNSCAIAMAIASMGGAFIDCNQLFIQLSEYTKQEICGLTIFNMTAREDLQSAFDLISRMISPPADSPAHATHTCMLRGNMKHRTDLGLSITLIKDEEGIAKCFCVSLIRNPLSPYDEAPPVHATAALVRHKDANGNYITQEMLNGGGMNVDGNIKTENLSSPAFMTG